MKTRMFKRVADGLRARVRTVGAFEHEVDIIDATDYCFTEAECDYEARGVGRGDGPL